MNASAEDAFDTIESAHDFITLLAETVAEAKRTLETDVQRESSSGFSRHLDTLRVAQYSMAKLETHVNGTGRILNDLRTLRRLLFEERSTAMSANTSTIRSATSAAPPPSTTHNTTLQNVAAI